MVRNADRLLQAASCVYRRFSGRSLSVRSSLPDYPENILAVRLAYIGDAVMTQPAFAVLKDKYPQSRLTFLTSSDAAPLFRSDPHLDEVLVFDAPWFKTPACSPDGKMDCLISEYGRLKRLIREKNFDLGIDFRGDVRNIFWTLYYPKIRHRLSYNSGGGGELLTHPVDWKDLTHKVDFHLNLLREAGMDCPTREPRLYPARKDTEQVKILLAGYNINENDHLIIIHPKARLPLKEWPLERYIELAARLLRNYQIKIILTGLPKDWIYLQKFREISEQHCLNLAGKLDIRKLAALYQQAKLFIGNDSAPGHIAAATGVPTLSIFGPSLPQETAPWSKMNRTVFSQKTACREKCDENSCRNNTMDCLKNVSVEEVFKTAEEMADQLNLPARRR